MQLLVVIVVLGVAFAEHSGSYLRSTGKIFDGPASTTTAAADEGDCLRHCSRESDCTSYAFDSSTKKCFTYTRILNSPTLNNENATLYQKTEFPRAHGENLGACRNHSCQHQAPCVRDSFCQDGYKCTCLWPWKGLRCDQKHASSPLLVQTITDTVTNRQPGYFVSNGKYYMVIPNGAHATSGAEGRLYQYDGATFHYISSFGQGSVGYMQANAFTVNLDTFVTLSGYKDMTAATPANSDLYVYKWTGTGLTIHHTVDISASITKGDFIKMADGNRYIVVPTLSSQIRILKWNGATFQIQYTISMIGAVFQSHFFKMGDSLFLAVSDYGAGTNALSAIYRLQDDDSWVLHQSLSGMTGCTSMTTSWSEDGEFYLAAAVHYNQGGNSRFVVFRWNQATQQFDQHQTVVPGGVQFTAKYFNIGGKLFLATLPYSPLWPTSSTQNFAVNNWVVIYQLVGSKLAEKSRFTCPSYCGDFLHIPTPGKDLLIFTSFQTETTTGPGHGTYVYEW